jgi:hypothetical protein
MHTQEAKMTEVCDTTPAMAELAGYPSARVEDMPRPMAPGALMHAAMRWAVITESAAWDTLVGGVLWVLGCKLHPRPKTTLCAVQVEPKCFALTRIDRASKK